MIRSAFCGVRRTVLSQIGHRKGNSDYLEVGAVLQSSACRRVWVLALAAEQTPQKCTALKELWKLTLVPGHCLL